MGIGTQDRFEVNGERCVHYIVCPPGSADKLFFSTVKCAANMLLGSFVIILQKHNVYV